MRPGRAQRGAALVDYLGVVLVVGLLLLALTAVREHSPQRRPPIDPVAHLARLVAPPPAPRPPRVRTAPRPRPRTTAPAPRRPRPPVPPRPTVLVPGWAVGS